MNKIGLFHIKHPVPLVLQDQIVQSRRMNMQKKTESSTTIINYYKNYCMMAFFLYSNCDICLKYDRLTVIKYIEKNFNRPKKK